MGRFENTAGVLVPRILMPKKGTDMTKWAVVACDQYTSQPDYWEKAEEIVGDAPSTLRLMLPEMYLDKPGEAERIVAINAAMNDYMDKGVLTDVGEGFMLVKRTVDGRTRTGLVMALDLECYDYAKGSGTLIRATEGTIVARIPPRLRIRKDAPLELPHILVLIDDPDGTVIEAAEKLPAEPMYDFELMQKGGHIKGSLISDEAGIKGILRALEALADKDAFAKKYGAALPPLLFAMGDGNHSFATAKANWENTKAGLTEAEKQDHPARFALIELENVHDAGIIFEPIHRVLFGTEPDRFITELATELTEHNGTVTVERFSCANCMKDAMAKECSKKHILPFNTENGVGYIAVEEPSQQLPVGTLQAALDALLKKHTDVTIDYIHGDDIVRELGSKPGNIGFTLPPMDKSDLFRTVVFDGALPRKTFSMGEAHEKRYYLECRRIK